MSHIMLDLETLDTRPSALIVALGAVKFDPNGSGVLQTFYRVPNDWGDQARHGRTLNPDTVAWWLKQSDAARNALTSPPKSDSTSTAQMLNDFVEFCEGSDVKMWGNGADFDCTLLGSLYADYGIKKPWTYSNNRCFRTMKNLGLGAAKPARVGVHHNALDDATTQALHLQEIFKCLRSR